MGTNQRMRKKRQIYVKKKSPYEFLVNNSPQGLLILDENQICSFVNPSGASILRLEQKEIIHSSFDKLALPKEYLKDIVGAISSVIGSGKRVEFRTFYKSGVSVEQHAVLVAPYTPDSNEMKGVMIYLDKINNDMLSFDKTSRNRDDVTLEYLESIISILPAAAFVADKNGKLIATNELASRIFYGNAPYPSRIDEFEYVGYKPGTRELYKPTDWGLARAVLHGETSIDEEVEILRADGSFGTFLISASPIRNKKGEIIGSIEIDTDVTSLKELQKDLATAKASLEAVINQMPVCVAIAESSSCNLIMSNKAYDELMGTPTVGSSIFQKENKVKMLDQNMTPITIENNPLMKAMVSGNTSVGDEALLQDVYGKIRPIITCAAPIFDDSGQITAGVSIIIDVSEIKKYEKEMIEKIDRLTYLNSELQKYAYTTSQDLREFLKMLSTYLQFIERSS